MAVMPPDVYAAIHAAAARAARLLVERMDKAPARVKHLARYGKKLRTRKKNLRRIVKGR